MAELSNIIKIRDDNNFFKFSVQEKSKDTNEYEIKVEHGNATWAIKEGKLSIQELRNRIEPWLTALFQSEHLSLLTGSGLTHAITEIVNKNCLDKTQGKKDLQVKATSMEKNEYSQFTKCIKTSSKDSAQRAGRKEGNFEDEIRTVNELLRGLDILCCDDEPILSEIRTTLSEQKEKLKNELESKLRKFADSILETEKNIVTQKDISEKALGILINFLMSFASRNGTRDRLQIFTTNYDRILEEGADLAGLRLLDRFVGSLTPVFRSSRIDVDMHYNTPGIRGEPRYLEGVAHYTKLHGSIDWVQTGSLIRRIGLPLGANTIEPYLEVPGFINCSANQLMIFPNSSKDTETSGFPFVDMFRDFAAAICRPNSTVVTYGYSFGDDHINRVLKDMLSIPSTHLLIISYDDPLGRIMQFFDSVKRNCQISLLIGPVFSDIENLTNYYLPKSAIDMNSYRLREILKERYSSIEKKGADE